MFPATKPYPITNHGWDLMPYEKRGIVAPISDKPLFDPEPDEPR